MIGIKKILSLLFFINIFFGSQTYLTLPIQEGGRIKPLDSFAKNQLLLFYGKEAIKQSDNEDQIPAIKWFMDLLSNPSKELEREIFYISNWANSPEVEVSLGLDSRESHLYSFYEIIEGFQNNQSLLEGLKNKSEESYTHVEKQIVDIYTKVVFLDEIAHSFMCFVPLIEVSNIEVSKALNIELGQKLSYSFFVTNIELFSPLMQELLDIAPENWTEKHQELNKIALELHGIGQYQYAKALKIFPQYSIDEPWLSPWELMEIKDIDSNQRIMLQELEAFIINYANNNEFEYYFINFLNAQKNVNDNISLNNLNLEIHYNNFDYFFKSLILYILSFLVIGIAWLSRPKLLRLISLGLFSIGFILHTAGIIIRMIIMQRPPVSTLYESVLFVCFVLVLLAIIYELIRKDTFGIFVGSIGGIILHYIGLKYAADGDTLTMLVAVLNSNFWLSIHVTTITFGYGVSILAGLMGHLYLILSILKQKKSILKKVHNNIYVITIIALFFTLFGTILGGIWADQSWGRFWGWDPKENGALLIVMWHLMMLHARIAGMVKPLGFAFGISLVNIIVALAWFGVNLLSVGLHSYGFTDNVATNLFMFIGLELLFSFSCYFYIKYKM